MNTVAISKIEYEKIKQGQRDLSARIRVLERKLQKPSEPGIKLSVLKKWGKRAKEMEQGKIGHKFSDIKEFKKFLETL